MPGIAQDRSDGNQSIRNGISCSNGKGFWSNRTHDISYSQLQKFWNELSSQARQKLLRIDKQTLFEHARKNMYCSRCNGLLLEGFLQIAMYGKSLQQQGAASQYLSNGLKTIKTQDDVQDPSVHPWGGLTATRDGMLTLLDRYLFSNSLKGLQNVFDSARARERERELLYPDACGGGGRGWISQGMAGYGRGHGTRETCALHTARLSVDTLVDFWSALGEETRQSLLRMKEEDFIERLMYRFDSKRFCRDCRRNVIREFKELKELKRMRKEPHCTSWFCVADTAFQYEVSQDTVQADWHSTFLDNFGVYHHFEWAIGTGEGKSDVMDYENVGLSGRVQVTGLDLNGLNACYITLRAWKMDGRCTELSVKAHALKGQQCVHCRIGVDDGFVTITRGESIRMFFEHAEEAEEEEGDESIDKDGNDLDGECSRPQKHAKSPELAREFLLDAATVIFKEQVEKAFREGTARQNAHSIFVCQALKLLEERVHVSCKEIITLEKQMKLLEEEEIEKREEEERKERRKNKEREKKLRRKERLREKDKDKKKGSESNQHSLVTDTSKEDSIPCADEVSNDICDGDGHEICDELAPSSPDIEEEQLSDEFIYSNMQDQSDDNPDLDYAHTKYAHDSVSTDKLQSSRRKLKFQKDFYQDSNMKWPDRRLSFLSETGNWMAKHEQRHLVDDSETSRHPNGANKLLHNDLNSNIRNDGPKVSEKFHCSNPRTSDRHGSHTHSCKQQSEYRVKIDTHLRESKYASKPESAADVSKPYYRGNKNNHVEYVRDSSGRLKSKSINSYNSLNRGTTSTRRVWEPIESHKKYPRSNSDSDFTLKSTLKDETNEYDQHKTSSNADRLVEVSRDLNADCDTDQNRKGRSILSEELSDCTHEESKLRSKMRSSCGTSVSSVSSSSNSDNCSSCLSDSNASLTNSQNIDSSSTSDSDDFSQNSEGRESSPHTQNEVSSCHETSDQKRPSAGEEEQHYKNQTHDSEGPICSGLPITMPPKLNGRVNIDGGAQSQILFPQSHNQNVHFPIFQPPTLGFYHQSPVSWPATPANGYMTFPHPSHYVFPSPYGYGLNGNTQVMQYGSLQHLTPPLLNHHPLPVFHPVAQTDGINSMENQKIANLGGLKEVNSDDANLPKGVLSGEHTQGATKNIENGKPSNPTSENTGFSLFHFGGPVALSTGLKSSPISSNEGTISDLSPITNLIKSDHVGNPKNCGEEYNLFAASNGIKFSFF